MNLTNERTHFDVIIVGGRVAGSTLAARLAPAGLNILLLERGQLPSPHPASSPIIHPNTMHLLDDIGADETMYAQSAPRLGRFVYEIQNFRAFNQSAFLHGRGYGYAINRGHFDHTLWQMALRYPNVVGYQSCAVVDLLWEGERVVGVKAKRGGETVTFYAPAVVGADGRFSFVARKVNAPAYSTFERFPTSAFYAYWEGVTPYDETGEPTIHFISAHRGVGMLMLEAAEGKTAVVVEGQTAKLHPAEGGGTDIYLDWLKKTPAAWRRLQHGRPVTAVHGMKNITNGFRQAYGPGWALVGDAVHQKDPVDGQGIYDALFSAKCLAEALLMWHSGTVWETALAQYKKEMEKGMWEMYVATLITSFEYFYLPLDNPLLRTVARWWFEDPEYRRRLALFLGRGFAHPRRWRPWWVLAAAMAKGAGRDVRNWLTNKQG